LKELIQLSKKALYLLPLRDRKRVIQIAPILIALSILDLLGVILLGTVATLTFNLVSNDARPTRLEIVLQGFLPNSTSKMTLILILSIIAILLLTSKTVIQAYFGYRFAIFQARLECDVSSKLYDSLLDENVSTINQFKYTDYHYALSLGANRYVTGILGSSVMLISDLFTTVLMMGFAFYASPQSAMIIIVVFLAAYLLFNGPINSRAKAYGQLSYSSHLSLSESLLESLGGIREIKSYGREEMYKKDFRSEKAISSLINQKIVWLNGLVRYFLEISILTAGGLVALGLFVTTDLRRAITVTAVFIIIGFRIVPNIQRLQNSLNSLRIAKEATKTLFIFLDKFKTEQKFERLNEEIQTPTINLIELKNVSFGVESAPRILNDVSFRLKGKNTLAIIGNSGSGKSTLIDLIAGLIEPTRGSVKFSTFPEGIEWSNGRIPISYITQKCALFGQDLYQNISLSRETSPLEKEKIDEIVKDLNLHGFLRIHEGDLREIRTDSTNISGGERQRISIARAKYFDTDIVILDEPTSALDSENESRVLGYLRDIWHKKTVLVVTHSREVLKVADYVVYLNEGEMLFFGSVSDFGEWETTKKPGTTL
jgi:ABC-type multidrug transport system fused ATPase/permease subunit